MSLTRFLLPAIAMVLLLYCLLAAGLFFAQRSLIYPAPKGAGPDVAGFERIGYQTEDGLILTGGYRAGELGKPVLLFFHGNATTWQGGAEALLPLAADGYGVFAAEYRGYADNPGSPNETGLYHDGRAAIAWLESNEIGASDIVLVGNSLGSGVAVQMATEMDAAGLALISPYSSMTELVGEKVRWLPIGLLLRDHFASREKIGALNMPVLILHGERDRVIPVAHADRLASLADGATLWKSADAGHELMWLDESREQVSLWLKTLTPKDAN